MIYDIYHLPLHPCICHISLQAFIYHLQIKLFLTSWARSLYYLKISYLYENAIHPANLSSLIRDVNRFRPSLGCKRFLSLVTIIRNIDLATCFLHHCCTTSSVIQLSPYTQLAHSTLNFCCIFHSYYRKEIMFCNSYFTRVGHAIYINTFL